MGVLTHSAGPGSPGPIACRSMTRLPYKRASTCGSAGPPGGSCFATGVGVLFGRLQHAMACRRAGRPWPRSARGAPVTVAQKKKHAWAGTRCGRSQRLNHSVRMRGSALVWRSLRPQPDE